MNLATTLDDPVGAVRSLTEQIRAECGDIDATLALPVAVVGALQQAEIFRLMAPVEIGGHEVDPVTFLNVVEAASHADGSVGWCVLIGGCYATFGGLLPDKGARAIYGDPNTISAARSGPTGRPSKSMAATESAGGGRWPAVPAMPTGTSEVAPSFVTANRSPIRRVLP